MISNQSNEQKKDIKKKKNLKKRREEEEAKMGVNNGVVIVIVDNFAFVRHLGWFLSMCIIINQNIKKGMKIEKDL